MEFCGISAGKKFMVDGPSFRHRHLHHNYLKSLPHEGWLNFWLTVRTGISDPELVFDSHSSLPVMSESVLIFLSSMDENVEGVENLSKWSPEICSLSWSSIEFCGTSAGKKEFMVDGLLAKLGIGIVLPISSSPFATGLPVLFCTVFPPVALWSISKEFLDKVSVMNRLLLVDCQTRFPVSQTHSMYQITCFGRGST